MHILEKPYTEQNKVDFIVKYNHELGLKIEETPIALYALEENEIMFTDDIGIKTPIINPEWENINLNSEKERLIKENDILRDETINGGVAYKGVLFDSDTDQKINLFATYNLMSDLDTITWFGMDNAELVCNKEDLMNIGQLINQLHSFCWSKNAEIKNRIQSAENIEDLEQIEIIYTEELDDIIE